MTSPSRSYDVLTFDCYGTLIDWEAGLWAAFADAAGKERIPLDQTGTMALYAAVEPEVERESFRPYRHVLAESARRLAERVQWPLSLDEAAFLPESLPTWPAFPDTNPALERLKVAGFQLGILSNVDDDLLAASCRHFSVAFDFLITAQQVRSYKPAHGHFLRARGHIGGARWLHVAQSYFHDVVPAVDLGIPVAWINRKGDQPSGSARAGWTFSGLTGLADWLTG